jgi:hypothetical protein
LLIAAQVLSGLLANEPDGGGLKASIAAPAVLILTGADFLRLDRALRPGELERQAPPGESPMQQGEITSGSVLFWGFPVA